MSPSIAQSNAALSAELVYDLVLDHSELLMALDGRPRRLPELAALLGESPDALVERLAELLAAGLVEDTGAGYRCPQASYELSCQEALLDFLRDQVLPALGQAIDPTGRDALLVEAEGQLGPAGLAGFEAGALASFWNQLEVLQRRHDGERRWQLDLILAGSPSRPPAQLAGPGPRALWRVERSSQERAAERAAQVEAPASMLYQVRLTLHEDAKAGVLAAAHELLGALRAGRLGPPLGLTVAGRLKPTRPQSREVLQ